MIADPNDREEIKISVVIPCYNAERCIGQTVSSVLKQTRPPDELIFIDDGSTDQTRKRLDFYSRMKSEFEINVYYNDKNMGIGYTRQKGIDVSKCNYVSFLSADDIWDKGFLEKSVNILESINDINFGTYTDYYKCDEKLNPLNIFRCPEFSKDEMIKWALKKNLFINFSSIVFPKNIKAKFEKRLRRGEDLIFILDAVISGFYWFRIADPLLYYRRTKGTFELNNFIEIWEHSRARLKKLGIDDSLIIKCFNESYGKVTKSVYRSWVEQILSLLGK